jgi:hypothetical protein
MRARLLISLGLVTVAWIAACGGSSGSSGDLVASDAGDEGSTSPEGSTVGDGSTLPPAAACDTTAVAACGTRKCDPSLGCVQCVTNPDCTGTNKFCIRGRCEACSSNADCGVAAPACSPVDHLCHLSCLNDGGARCQGQTPLCDPATGACVGCQTNTDCPATAPLCDPTTKSCVQCEANSDCPASQPRCFLANNTCVACIVNADCGTGKACDPQDHRCVAVCTSDLQCQNGNNNQTKCNVTTGACVQCLAGTDCKNKQTPICATPQDRCVQCVTATDCNADAGLKFCEQSQCVQCINNNDCPGPNPKCNNGQCN